jgi:hypothetical protein
MSPIFSAPVTSVADMMGVRFCGAPLASELSLMFADKASALRVPAMSPLATETKLCWDKPSHFKEKHPHQRHAAVALLLGLRSRLRAAAEEDGGGEDDQTFPVGQAGRFFPSAGRFFFPSQCGDVWSPRSKKT